jgi:hypothetical protein
MSALRGVIQETDPVATALPAFCEAATYLSHWMYPTAPASIDTSVQDGLPLHHEQLFLSIEGLGRAMHFVTSRWVDQNGTTIASPLHRDVRHFAVSAAADTLSLICTHVCSPAFCASAAAESIESFYLIECVSYVLEQCARCLELVNGRDDGSGPGSGSGGGIGEAWTKQLDVCMIGIEKTCELLHVLVDASIFILQSRRGGQVGALRACEALLATIQSWMHACTCTCTCTWGRAEERFPARLRDMRDDLLAKVFDMEHALVGGEQSRLVNALPTALLHHPIDDRSKCSSDKCLYGEVLGQLQSTHTTGWEESTLSTNDYANSNTCKLKSLSDAHMKAQGRGCQLVANLYRSAIPMYRIDGGITDRALALAMRAADMFCGVVLAEVMHDGMLEVPRVPEAVTIGRAVGDSRSTATIAALLAAAGAVMGATLGPTKGAKSANWPAEPAQETKANVSEVCWAYMSEMN